MQLSKETVDLLETLEMSIDPAVEEDYLSGRERFLAHEDESAVFAARHNLSVR